MAVAAPFGLVAELELQVRPHVVNPPHLLVKRVIGSSNDVVLLFQSDEHVPDYETDLAEKLSPRHITCVTSCDFGARGPGL